MADPPVQRREPTPTVSVLKSVRYGAQWEHDRTLPYRIDLLAAAGLTPTWTDAPAPRAVRRLEQIVTPFHQAWSTRRLRRDAAAVLAMFESEGHGLALARSVTRRKGPPLVVLSCWLADLTVGSPRRRRLYRRLYRQVDAVIVLSRNQVTTLTEGLGLAEEQVHVVRFGIDLDALAAVPTDEQRDVVAVGRDLGRDWATFADAVRDTGWSADLVTRRAQVSEVDLPGEVERHEPLDHATYLRMLAEATVVVVPTHVREYPTGQTVLLEAMALGKACVVTDTPAMRDYVIDGETGLLVPPRDPLALREAIRRLRDDAPLRHRIGAAAREREANEGGARRMWAEVAQVVTVASS